MQNRRQRVLCRTCVSCRQARIKCDGSAPCNRCESKEMICQYLHRKPRRSRALKSREKSSVGESNAMAQAVSTHEINESFPRPPTAHELPIVPHMDEHELPIVSHIDEATAVSIPSPGHQGASPETLRIEEHFHLGIPLYAMPEADPLNNMGPPALTSESIVQNWDLSFESWQPADFHQSNEWNINWLPFDTIGDALCTDWLNHGQDDLQAEAMHQQSALATQQDTFGSSANTSRRQAVLNRSRFQFLQDAVIDDHTSPASAGSNARSSKSSNTYYIDGRGARESRVSRRYGRQEPIQDTPVNIPTTTSQQTASSIPLCEQADNSVIHPTMYETIVNKVQKNLANNRNLSNRFGATFSLSNNHMDFLAKLFFTRFYPTFPLVSKASLFTPSQGWPLAMAICAIGARCVSTISSHKLCEMLVLALHSLLIEEVRWFQARLLKLTFHRLISSVPKRP